jgi:RNA polymerase sigma-70 factor, ECF subfamily
MNQTPPNPMAFPARSQFKEPDAAAPSDRQDASADERLLQRVSSGDQQAMTEIFDRYSRLVFSVAVRVLADPGQAEDVMQEVFLKVWREPQSFLQDRGRLGAWLAVITRNRAIDSLRRRRPSDSVEDVILIARTDIASEVEHNSLLDKVRGAMKILPPEQKLSMELAYFEGLSHSEIAARTGDPLGTVKTRIRSALLNLRKAFEA